MAGAAVKALTAVLDLENTPPHILVMATIAMGHWHLSFVLGDDDVHVLFFLLFFSERRLLKSSFIFFSFIITLHRLHRHHHHHQHHHHHREQLITCHPSIHLNHHIQQVQYIIFICVDILFIDDCHGQAPPDGPSKSQATTFTSDGLMDDHHTKYIDMNNDITSHSIRLHSCIIIVIVTTKLEF